MELCLICGQIVVCGYCVNCNVDHELVKEANEFKGEDDDD